MQLSIGHEGAVPGEQRRAGRLRVFAGFIRMPQDELAGREGRPASGSTRILPGRFASTYNKIRILTATFEERGTYPVAIAEVFFPAGIAESFLARKKRGHRLIRQIVATGAAMPHQLADPWLALRIR